MVENTRIAYHASSNPEQLEKTLIQRLSPPLNIAHQKAQNFAKCLTALRRAVVTRGSTPWVPAGPVRRAAYEKLTRMQLQRGCDSTKQVERGVTFSSLDAPQIPKINIGYM